MLSLWNAAVVSLSALALFASTILFTLFHRCRNQVLEIDKTDEFISSRFQQPWWSIGSSLYVGAVGLWILTVPVGVGAQGGPTAIVLYALGCSLSWASYLYLGQKLRQLLGHEGCTVIDFMKKRYGRYIYGIIMGISMIYLLILLTTEYVTIITLFNSMGFPKLSMPVVIIAAIVSVLYSLIGGFPATMIANRFIGIITVVFILACFGVAYNQVLGRIPHIQAIAKGFTEVPFSTGLMKGLPMFVSVMIVELSNQGTWQRCFAAKTSRDMKLGFGVAMPLMFFTMVFVGFLGCLALEAKLIGAYDFPHSMLHNSLFIILSDIPDALSGFLIFVGLLIALSSLTYIQTAMIAVLFGARTQSFEMKQSNLFYVRALLLLINTVFVYIAIQRPTPILFYFTMCNIFVTPTVPIIIMSFFPLATELGAVIAIGAGLLTLGLMAIVIGEGVWDSLLLEINWMTLYTFLFVFLASLITCYVASSIHIYYKPEIHSRQIAMFDSLLQHTAKSMQIHSISDEENLTNQALKSKPWNMISI